MNAATHTVEGSAKVPVLYMALELSNETWRIVSNGASGYDESAAATESESIW
jgi:hypothetical protein